ncbi:MAG TPA: YIP1 family protein [Gemmatimonadaceae bacterium]|nr:YIP1 family protein [Gemmatimonadaceae bacterium]
MTAPSADAMEAPAPAVKPTALWEDFIDIFYAPSTVFERRRNANPWPMILIVTVIVTLIGVLTWNSLSPVFESEIRTQFAKAMAANPQMTADMVDSQVKIQMAFRRWGGVMFPIGVLIFGLLVWAMGRISGAKELTYQRALVVVAWGSIISIVAALVMGVQGLVLDVSAMTSTDALSIGPARFVDKATTSPILFALLKQLDVFNLWTIAVMAIGVQVAGRGTKKTAITFALIWFIGAFLISAVMAARAAAAAGG